MPSPRNWKNIPKYIISIMFVSLFCAIEDSEAACCKCQPKNDQTKNICLFVSEEVCPQNLTQKYSKLSGMTCEPNSYQNSECRAVSEGGFCNEKGEAAIYEPQTGTTQGTVQEADSGTARTVKEFVLPKMSTEVPGLQFSRVAVSESKLGIPFLAQYISALYKYAIGLSIVVAAVMVIYGGFLYILGSTAASISTGKQKMVDALVGLILVMTVYVLLALINPETTKLQPIFIKPTAPADLTIMMEQGFSPGGESQIQNMELNVPIPGTARALPPANQVTVVPEGGKPPEDASGTTVVSVSEPSGEPPNKRLRSYCTSAKEAQNAKTYDERIPLLVRAILGFYKICISEKACVYLRGGYWNGTKSVAGASDVPFIVSFLNTYTSYSNSAQNSSVWDPDCIANYNKSLCFANQTGNTCNPSEQCAPYMFTRRDACPAGTPQLPTRGKCYEQILSVYKKELVDKLNQLGYYGSDCGGTALAIYNCAGAQTSRPLTHYTQFAGRGKGPDFPVYDAKSYDDFVNQLKASSPDGNGNFKFGDMITTVNPIHTFLYTGGRTDVPFEIFEMGGGGPADLKPEGANGVRVPGLKIPVSGMKATPKLPQEGEAMLKYVKWWYDRGVKTMAVARPFDFVSCESKADCQNDEICHCAYWDYSSAQRARNHKPNSCGSQFTCHKTRLDNPAMPCANDEECAKGWSCVQGKGRKDCKKD